MRSITIVGKALSEPSGFPGPSATACTECAGAGVYLLDGVVTPCECQRAAREARRRRRLLAASSFTPEMERLTFASFEDACQPDACTAIRRLLDGSEDRDALGQPWVYLGGAPGTGKTHLLAASVNALQARGHDTLYVIVADLLDFIRAGFAGFHAAQGSDDQNQGDPQARLRLVREVAWLFLDELGKESETDYANEQVFKLLDYRYRRRLPTVIASNYPPQEFPSYLASRFGDVARCQTVFMRPKDYRKRAAHERGPRAGAQQADRMDHQAPTRKTGKERV